MAEREDGFPQNGQLPVISPETAARIAEDLGLDISGSTRSVLEGITKERQPQPFSRIGEQASEVIYDLVAVNPKLAEALEKGIREGYCYGENTYCRTDIIKGMALVLRAFHIESEYGLMERLSRISGETSLARVTEIVKQGLGEKVPLDPIEVALKVPKISDVQINLNGLVGRSLQAISFRVEFKMGAGTMFRVLSEFKSELFPPKENPPGINQSPSI